MYSIFSPLELQPIKRFLLDYRVTLKDNLPDTFTLKNLETVADMSKINVQTRSNIFAPFSTTISIKEEQKQPPIQINKSLQVLNQAINFIPLVFEQNRAYEMFSNGLTAQENIIPEQKMSINLESSLYNENNQKQKSSSPAKPYTPWRDGKYQKQEEQSKEQIQQNFNESLIKQIEEWGYSKEYIITSLKNNEFNYCTAGYYLLIKVIE